MKSERSAGLFARLSKANSSEVREFADDAINNLGVPGTHLSSPLPHVLCACPIANSVLLRVQWRVRRKRKKKRW